MRLCQTLLARAGRTRFKYFQRYIERERDQPSLRTTSDPLRGTRFMKKTDFYYAEHRPWTEAFKSDNIPGDRSKRVLIQPIEDMTIFKGDRVEILLGKDKGKQGIINSIVKERNWVYVEGLNCDYKTEQQYSTMSPMCSKEEKPLLADCQVKLVDPTDEQGTEVEWRYTEEGERVRVSLRTGAIVPLPSGAQEFNDMINPQAYMENDEKDTKEYDVTRVTFKPKCMTFEEEINEVMDIKDDRKPAKTYWY